MNAIAEERNTGERSQQLKILPWTQGVDRRLKKKTPRTTLVVQGLSLYTSAWVLDSIPGRVTKDPTCLAMQSKQQ